MDTTTTTPPAALLVIGAAGFVGSHLVAGLIEDGREVIAVSRNAARARRKLGPGVRVIENLADVPDDTRLDAIVNLAGAPVIGKPWSESRRRELIDSRVGPAKASLALMARLQTKPRVLVAASAVGFYGASPHASFVERDESSPPRPGEFQSDLCDTVELASMPAEAMGVRVLRMRFAVVLGRDGGAYPMLARGARLGLGAVLGSGRQPAPWVHVEDAVGLIRFVLDHETLTGPFNAVAPEVPTQARFTQALAASFGKSAWMRVPDTLLRVLAGEMSSLLLDGQNAVPHAALEAGYTFRHPTLEAALADLAARGS